MLLSWQPKGSWLNSILQEALIQELHHMYTNESNNDAHTVTHSWRNVYLL